MTATAGTNTATTATPTTAAADDESGAGAGTRSTATGARTPEATTVIEGARERIDVLDDRIIGLIQERMAVSAVIQKARIESGGRRVNTARENEILGNYSRALGKRGASLALTLLELSRGRI